MTCEFFNVMKTLNVSYKTKKKTAICLVEKESLAFEKKSKWKNNFNMLIILPGEKLGLHAVFIRLVLSMNCKILCQIAQSSK